MMGKTHRAISILTTTVLATKGIVNPVFGVIGMLGNEIPDLDLKINGVKHRTITHCLLTGGVITFLLIGANKDIAISFGANYFMHLLADSLTKEGVPFLFPFSKKKYGLKLFKTKGIAEKLIGFTATGTALFLILEYVYKL